MTILVAGGTGFLGPRIVKLLTARGFQVRIIARKPENAEKLAGNLVEIVKGDVRNPAEVDRAAAGVSTVVSAISGLAKKGMSPHSVDWGGNRNLIRSAKAVNAKHFVLISILGAGQDHPMELYRMKWRAEQELKASQLAWTIVRPSVYTESWGSLVWEPILRKGKTRIFGRGKNPINFVSAQDVARLVELAIVDPQLRGKLLQIGGPENLTMEQFVQTFEDVTGRTGTLTRIPLSMLRLMSTILRPINPTLARLAKAAIIMDSLDMSFDVGETEQRYPLIPLTRVADVVKRDYSPDKV